MFETVLLKLIKMKKKCVNVWVVGDFLLSNDVMKVYLLEKEKLKKIDGWE